MAEQNRQHPVLPPEDDQYTYEMVEEVIEDEDTPAQKQGYNRGCLWGIVGLGACLGIPLASLLLIGILGITSVSALFDGVADFFRGEPRQATVETTRTIVNAMEARGTLETFSISLSRTNVRVSVREGFQNACGYGASHAVEGTVEAGIKLDDLAEDAISYDAFRETWTVTLPAPSLTSCRIDFIQQYNRSQTFCGITWDNARQIAQYTSLVDFRDEALEGGILDRAAEEALPTLEGFLTPFTEANIEIRFADPDPDEPHPPSCDPLIPPGWTYNPDNNTWSN